MKKMMLSLMFLLVAGIFSAKGQVRVIVRTPHTRVVVTRTVRPVVIARPVIVARPVVVARRVAVIRPVAVVRRRVVVYR